MRHVTASYVSLAVILALILGVSPMERAAAQAQSDALLSIEPQDSQAASDPSQSSPLAFKLSQTVAIADFNADGMNDVAAVDFLRDVVHVMTGDAEGRLTPVASLPSGRGPRSVVAGDFNLDGALDIAVGSFFSGDVRIFSGNGAGQFGRPTAVQLEPGLASVGGGGDIDGDGDVDLIAANFLTGQVSVLTSAPGGTLERGPTIGHASGTSLVLVRDVNGDGMDDVLAVDASGANIRLLTGNVSRGFDDAGLVAPQVAFPDNVQPDASIARGALGLRVASGDGQAGRPGSVLPQELVFEARTLDGDPLVGGQIVFSPVVGAVSLRESAQWTDDDGTITVPIVAADFPQNQLVAAAVPGAGVVVAGALSALPPASFKDAVHYAASPTADATRLETALASLTTGTQIEAVANLMALVGRDTAQPSSADDPASAVLKSAINQLLMIGPASPGPDLRETAVGDPPAVVTLKGTFTATDTVLNEGTHPAGASNTRYYLSVDGVQKTTRLGGGGRNVPALNPSQNSQGSDVVSVPASTRTRSYFLLACADDRGVVTEDDETDNCLASSGQVQVKAADLIVSALSEPPATVEEGGTFAVSDTTGNIGDWPSGASTTRYYLSLDNKKSNSDILAASRGVPGLAPGGNSADSGTATANAAPNSYFLIACADALKKVAEGNATKSGEKNNCRVSAGKVTVTPGGSDGGPLDNGALRNGRISVAGEIDEWTFAASAGQRISVHIGEIVDDNDFRPWIRLISPTDALLAETSGVAAAVIDDVIAPATGTYRVRVASFDSGFDGTGTYRLTTTYTPGPITVSAGDQGGPLTNGAIHQGEILQGDVDVWTFTANAGERISVHIGEITDTDDFRPWIRLWTPAGGTEGDTSGVAAAVIDDVIAPVTGTYLVQVATFDSGFDGEGTYRLTMTRTPGPITVSPGDQGGPLTLGTPHSGEIVLGDVDVWTLTVTAGHRITVNVTETAEFSDQRPWIRLWAPSGATLGDTSGTTSAQITNAVAPVSGTYLVLVASFDPGLDGSGTYDLVVTVSPP